MSKRIVWAANETPRGHVLRGAGAKSTRLRRPQRLRQEHGQVLRRRLVTKELFGHYINPDEFESAIMRSGHLDFQEFNLEVSESTSSASPLAEVSGAG